jgi:hypothetical protein
MRARLPKAPIPPEFKTQSNKRQYQINWVSVYINFNNQLLSNG